MKHSMSHRFSVFGAIAIAVALSLITSVLPVKAIFNSAVDRLIGTNVTFPVVSGCGTGTLGAGSGDMAGEFTATGATGCTLTFGTPYVTAPSCAVTEETVNTAARTTTVTNTALVVASGTSGSKYSYVCVAKSGG